MRSWGRAPRELSCGSCLNRTIAIGEPVSYWQELPNRPWSRLRCVECAGEAPPPLPDLVETKAHDDVTMTRIRDAAPTRTRGALRTLASHWLPYSDQE